MSSLLIAVLATLLPIAQGGGDEVPLAEDAVEPTIAVNRLEPPLSVLVIAYMKNSTIERVFSTDQGASFRPAARVDTEGQTLDPTLAANLSNGTFYLNYLGAIQGQSAGHWSTTSPDGDVFSNHTTLQNWISDFDRPWLVAAEQHVWMSYVDTRDEEGYAFFRAGAVSGSTVTWPANGVVWVPDVFPPLEHNPQAIIARGKCNCGLTPHSDEVYGIAVQMHQTKRYRSHSLKYAQHFGRLRDSLASGSPGERYHQARMRGQWGGDDGLAGDIDGDRIVGDERCL